MGMVVRSNIMALNANRQLGMNNSQVSKSLEKLSSGYKINRAGDDASGLAISEKMKAQIKGLETKSTVSHRAPTSTASSCWMVLWAAARQVLLYRLLRIPQERSVLLTSPLKVRKVWALSSLPLLLVLTA